MQQPGGLRAVRRSVKALQRTHFATGDFVAGATVVGRFDVALCLSVTKWLHFNGGDAAVSALFDRVFRTLHPGGLFVLEPQPWKSYRQVFKKPVRCCLPLCGCTSRHGCATPECTFQLTPVCAWETVTSCGNVGLLITCLT